MQAIRAIYDGATFRPTQPIPVNGKYEVVITFLEPLTIEEQIAVRPPFEYGSMSVKISNELFTAVKNAIDEWNPYSLLPDAPADEFDGESRMILGRISKNSPVDEIASVVSDVFSRQFEPKYFHMEVCLDVAKAIKSNIESVRA